MSANESLPVIDVSALVHAAADRADVARRIGEACRAHGFFYVTGHGIDAALVAELEAASRRFFALDETTKMQWPMALGGRAWRGYFPLGGELTSGRPDWKEGMYFGTELADEHPLVRAATPLHGRNLFPDLPGFGSTVLAYMAAVTALGHRLMEGIALSLDLPSDYFARLYTADPLILFRLFNYPSRPVPAFPCWSPRTTTSTRCLHALCFTGSGTVRLSSATGLWRSKRSLPRWMRAHPMIWC